MFNLAWRNIWRQRGRSLVTAIVIAFVVIFTLVYFGLLEAMKNGMFQRITESSGHISLRVENWRDKREFYSLLIPDAAEKRAALENIAQGAEVKAVLEVPALLLGEVRSRGIQLLGVASPTSETERFTRDYLLEGRLPAPDAQGEIALGQALAQALKVKLGDMTYALAPGTEGVGAMAFEVVGLLDLPEQSLEARFAYLSLPAAQELAAPGAVTQFEVYLPELRRLADEGAIEPLKATIVQALGPGLSIENWREANPALATYINIMDPIIIIFDALFFVLAGLLVVNTIYLSVLERVREFGVIIAMGANRWQVIRMVLLESLVLVASGSVVGFGIGLGLIGLMSRGFSMPSAESYAEFGIPTVMYASISLEQILITFFFALGTALLAALWPAWTAGRLQPVEAMRFAA
jgi:ABC-type lipoprotein release transport system permease subunit